MIAVVLSILVPGLGQIYYGKWLRALVMLLAGMTVLYPIALAWSVVDAYHLSRQGIEPQFSKKDVAAAMVLLLVVAPVCAIVLVYSFIWWQDSYLKRSATAAEGSEIAATLLEYREAVGRFPGGLAELVGNRPLRSAWLTDGWDRPYRYRLDAGGQGFELASAGRDGKLGTEDDLVWRP